MSPFWLGIATGLTGAALWLFAKFLVKSYLEDKEWTESEDNRLDEWPPTIPVFVPAEANKPVHYVAGASNRFWAAHDELDRMTSAKLRDVGLPRRDAKGRFLPKEKP